MEQTDIINADAKEPSISSIIVKLSDSADFLI